MCGIAGIVGRLPANHIRDMMLDRLSHRGPDNVGDWHSDRVWLGHARLSIVDLSPQANQPMATTDGNLRLVANGEIYNYSALRRSLKENEHRFVSNSDSEILLHLYRDTGLGFLPQLNGMFAFAIWDQRKNLLVLARDRLGIKPVYYWADGQTLIFASEIKSILAHPTVTAAIGLKGLKQYLTTENTLGGTTLFRDIGILPPGSVLTWQDGHIQCEAYWRPHFHENNTAMTFDEACRCYRKTASAAVSRHLMSDVPVASYLSSGFDSSIVTALAGRCLPNRRMKTFTGSFGSSGWYNETDGARAVADTIGADHVVVSIEANDLKRHFDDLIHSMDEPRMGYGAFSQFMVARKAAKHGKVILTGHGGDEFFAGYPVFKFAQMQKLVASGNLNVLRHLARTRFNEWPHVAYFTLNHLRNNDGYSFLPTLFSSGMLRRLLRPAVWRQLSDLSIDDPLSLQISDEADAYHRLMLTYLCLYLPGLFVVEDKISMAHALESRTPLCDNELLDLALQVPLSRKLENCCLKAIPKAAMRQFLPGSLYQLPKRGFPTPLSKWLRGPLRPWCENRLLGNDSALPLLFEPDSLRPFVFNYLDSWRRWARPLDEIATHRIWMLLSLEAWIRNNTERLGRRLQLA